MNVLENYFSKVTRVRALLILACLESSFPLLIKSENSYLNER